MLRVGPRGCRCRERVRRRDSAPLVLGDELVSVAGTRLERAPARRPRRRATSRFAVPRAQVLRAPVARRDHGARRRASAASSASSGGLDERHVTREQDHRVDVRVERLERAHAPSIAASGPLPGGSRGPRATTVTPGPTSITGCAHLREHTRAARTASVSPCQTIVALSLPIRRLAPPVSSTPGRSAVTSVGAIEYPTTIQPFGAPLEHRRCCAPCRRRSSTFVTTSAVWCAGRRRRRPRPSRRAGLGSRCSRTRAALGADELLAAQPVAELVTRRGRTASRSRVIPRAFVRDRDVGGPRAGFLPNATHMNDSSTKMSDGDRERHVSRFGAVYSPSMLARELDVQLR